MPLTTTTSWQRACPAATAQWPQQPVLQPAGHRTWSLIFSPYTLVATSMKQSMRLAMEHLLAR